MAMFTASTEATSILLSGGLGIAESLLRSGWTDVQVFYYLREKFTPIGGEAFGPAVYGDILRRAKAALEAGRTLNRRQSNNPLDYTDHIGMPGISTRYQYSVVVGFEDVDSGDRFTRLFRVGGQDRLGHYDVLGLVQQQVLAFLGNRPDYGPAAGDADIVQSGPMRITDALYRI